MPGVIWTETFFNCSIGDSYGIHIHDYIENMTLVEYVNPDGEYKIELFRTKIVVDKVVDIQW